MQPSYLSRIQFCKKRLRETEDPFVLFERLDNLRRWNIYRELTALNPTELSWTIDTVSRESLSEACTKLGFHDAQSVLQHLIQRNCASITDPWLRQYADPLQLPEHLAYRLKAFHGLHSDKNTPMECIPVIEWSFADGSAGGTLPDFTDGPFLYHFVPAGRMVYTGSIRISVDDGHYHHFVESHSTRHNIMTYYATKGDLRTGYHAKRVLPHDAVTFGTVLYPKQMFHWMYPLRTKKRTETIRAELLTYFYPDIISVISGYVSQEM